MKQIRYNSDLIVISAVNLVDGGTFSILKDCLLGFQDDKYAKKNIIALVNSKKNLPEYSNVEYLEYPKSKKNYFLRLYYEYFHFYKLSLKLKPEIWISLHDITPNVFAKKRYVYMHNPSPFFKKKKGEKVGFGFLLFIKFYKYIYRINVKKNTSVIVQQDWIRNGISELCKIDKEKIVVALPEFQNYEEYDLLKEYKKNMFFYASYPRIFKNFEIICAACDILQNDNSIKEKQWDVYLTINGSENFYSKKIVDQYKNNRHIHFLGILSREKVYEYYKDSECLIFPSRLETWGLPISEFKQFNKKMILADLPYAYETSVGANKVAFFNPDSAIELASIMKNIILGKEEKFDKVPVVKINPPYTKSWGELLDFIIKGEK